MQSSVVCDMLYFFLFYSFLSCKNVSEFLYTQLQVSSIANIKVIHLLQLMNLCWYIITIQTHTLFQYYDFF